MILGYPVKYMDGEGETVTCHGCDVKVTLGRFAEWDGLCDDCKEEIRKKERELEEAEQ